jgi:hypothetical protein
MSVYEWTGTFSRRYFFHLLLLFSAGVEIGKTCGLVGVLFYVVIKKTASPHS